MIVIFISKPVSQQALIKQLMFHQFAISLKPLWQDEPNPFHCQNKPTGTVTVAGSFISSLNVIVLHELF